MTKTSLGLDDLDEEAQLNEETNEEKEKREWRILPLERLGEKREVDNEITIKRRRKRQRARKR